MTNTTMQDARLDRARRDACLAAAAEARHDYAAAAFFYDIAASGCNPLWHARERAGWAADATRCRERVTAAARAARGVA